MALPRLPITAAASSAARSPTVATPSRWSRSRVTGPTPHSRSTGSGWRNASSSPGATSTTPGPGSTPSGSAAAWPPPTPAWRGTCSARRRPSSPARARRGSSSRIRRAIVTPSPNSVRAPVTSRNASSRASGSTSGVKRGEDLVHVAAHRRVQRVVAGEEHGRRAQAPGRPTASPRRRRTGGLRTTPRRRRHAVRFHRPRPAVRAARAGGATRPTRRTRPCRRGGSCARHAEMLQSAAEPAGSGSIRADRTVVPAAVTAPARRPRRSGEPQAGHEARAPRARSPATSSTHPALRSRKVIGNSTMLPPARTSRCVISIWKP